VSLTHLCFTVDFFFFLIHYHTKSPKNPVYGTAWSFIFGLKTRAVWTGLYCVFAVNLLNFSKLLIAVFTSIKCRQHFLGAVRVKWGCKKCLTQSLSLIRTLFPLYWASERLYDLPQDTITDGQNCVNL
jgi:hypothetical protein